MDMISSEPTQKVVVSFDEGSDHNQADAEFILRAVNCHDELLSALLAVVGLTTASELGADLEARVGAIIAKAEAQ